MLTFGFFFGGGVWQWLTTHEPSTEHDLSTGLREHFDPRARWRSAIGAVRGLHRLASLTKATAAAKEMERSGSTSSGGWRNGTGAGIDDDDDDDDEEVGKEEAQEAKTPVPKKSMEILLTAEEEEELQIPGSFDMANPRRGKRSGSTDDEDDDDDDDGGGGQAVEDDTSWAGLFKRMGLGS